MNKMLEINVILWNNRFKLQEKLIKVLKKEIELLQNMLKENGIIYE